MTTPVKPIPEGFHSLTPAITVHNGAEALEFYQRAFGAEVLDRFAGPDGTVFHSLLRVGDSRLMVNDEMKEMGLFSPRHYGGVAGAFMLYSADADALFTRAVAAGATPVTPVADTFSGDRHGVVKCPFGHRWILATRVVDVPSEEIQRRMEAFLAAAPKP